MRKNYNYSAFYFWIAFLLIPLFFAAASSTDIVKAEESGNVTDQKVMVEEQALPVIAVVAELAGQRGASVPPPEATADQAAKDVPANTSATKQDTSLASPSKDKKISKIEPAPHQPAAEVPAAEKNASPAPEGAPVQSKEATAKSALPVDKQGQTSVSTSILDTSKAPLIDTSHANNETALKAIEKNIALFKDKLRERFSVWLERSARYVEIMKDILREKNMPEELVFLPIVESGFNLHAYSRAKAVGPWQFIAATAKRYGLVIDWWRDERKDPVKSTKAAAEYLKDLYKMFGSWNLALAAYNAGEGRISKALKRSDAEDYWALLGTKQIRDETKEYVPRYIAATMIANTPEEYGFSNLEYHEPLEYDEVTITAPIDIEIIAKCAKCTVKEIRELNPELRRWSTPPNVPKYTIRIPAGTADLFQKNLAAIPKDERFTVETYIARKGDTIKKIARKTGTPVSAILAMNSLSGIERISAGDKIILPPQEKFYPDLEDKSEMSMARKAVYKKKIADKGSGKKAKARTGKKGKNGDAKVAKARGKAKLNADGEVKVRAKSKRKAAGEVKVKSRAKKSKVKTKKA